MDITEDELCFVCNRKVAKTNATLSEGKTVATKTDFPTKLSQLIGDEFMVVVSDEDKLCKRCVALINRCDELETNLLETKKLLIAFVNIKYNLNSEVDQKLDSKAKVAMEKWTNIKFKELMKPGSVSQPSKPYRYNRQLQFLKKTMEPRETTLSRLTEDSAGGNGGFADLSSTNSKTLPVKSVFNNFKKVARNKSRKNKQEIELLKRLKKNGRHTSFFNSIIPTLEAFHEDEIIQFQLNLMKVLSNIKKRKRTEKFNDELARTRSPQCHVVTQPCLSTNTNAAPDSSVASTSNLSVAQYLEVQ